LKEPNFRTHHGDGEDTPTTNFIKSRDDSGEITTLSPESLIDTPIQREPDPTPICDPEGLIRIVELLEDHDSLVQDNPTRIKFLCKYKQDTAEEVFSYNQLLDHITHDEDTDLVWKFKRIVSHQGPLTQEHPDYNGSSFNVMIEWENGEVTSEPLSVIAKDDPVSCAKYARDNGLMEVPGWKRLPPPEPPPEGYKRIRVHFVFDVKHDGRHKARLVADGHLTDTPLESVYSGVVSIRAFRIVTFLAELNRLNLWATDIGNAYLEAKTREKIYIIGGPEFGNRQDHFLIIDRALYGLKSSGARWHDRFADCMRDLHFFPCRAEPDVWVHKNGERYDYVAVYVDDLAIAMEDPKSFTDTLIERYKFKLKGTGPITFHLGIDFRREEDGTLCMEPRKYW
jgi:hypothetical protein